MSEDTHHRIIRQYSTKTFFRFSGSIGNNDLASMLTETDPDTATISRMIRRRGMIR